MLTDCQIMNKEELLDNIQNIFNNNLYEIKNGNLNYRFKNSKDIKSILNEHLNVPYLNVSRSEIYVPLLVENPEDYILDYPIMDTLKKLYMTVQNDKDLEKVFHEILDEHIKTSAQRFAPKHFKSSDPLVPQTLMCHLCFL